MLLWQLIKIIECDQVATITQSDDGEQWKGKFEDWVTDGSPMSNASVQSIFVSDRHGLCIEVW